MAIDHQRLLAAIDAAKENSYGSDEHSSLAAKRARWIEAYLGLNTNPAPEGRSQVVDRSVYETIHVMLPSLVRIFAGSSDEVCKFTPVGPEDEAAAEQTTAVLNHIVTQQNPWEQICSDWIHDAMLLANGYCLAYWDETQNLVRETYSGQSDDQLALLLQDQDVEVIQHSARPDEQGNADAQQAYQQALQQHQMMLVQWQQASAQAQMQGQPEPPPPMEPPPPQPIMLHDLVIERRANRGKVCIQVLPPEHCRISADTPNWTLRDCPYFEFRQQKTIADLRAMGLEVSEDVSDDEDNDQEEDDARNRFGEDSFNEGEEPGVMRRVWARMIWLKADAEDDGISRLYYLIVVGRTVLFAEPVGRIPVASLVTQPLPHRHIGMSVAETVLDLQDIKTAVTRGGLDNLYLANNGRHIVSSRVNLDDLLDSRPGGVVRMIDDSLPAEGHVLPLQHPFAFEQIIQSLEYFDSTRQNRTGANRMFAGTDAGAINRTATGTSLLQNAASMRVEHMARMMAPAIEYLFECVHEIISKHENKPLTIKLQGRWVSVDPQAWRTHRDVRISVGVGAGNKESMMAQLAQIFAAQMQLMPAGVAGPQQLHATVTEMAKLAGFANPGKFWLDPSSQPPRPPMPTPDQVQAQTALQIEQMKLQADQQKFQAQTQIEAAKIQMQAQAKQAEQQAALQVQAANDARDAEREQARIQLEAQLKQLEAENKAALERERLALERWKAELDAQTKLAVANVQQGNKPDGEDPKLTAVAQAVMALTAAVGEMNRPKQVIRDQAGKVVGVA